MTEKLKIYRRDDLTYSQYIDIAKTQSDPKAPSKEKSSSDFAPYTWDQTINMAENGWPEGVKKMLAIKSKLESVIKSKNPNTGIQYAHDFGFALDIPRFLDGEEPWMNFEPNYGTSVKKLYIGTTFNANIHPKLIEQRGAAVLALVDIIESSGYRCEIISTSWEEPCRGPESDRVATLVTIKEPQDIMDFDKLAFALINPCWLRRINFAFLEKAMTEDEKKIMGVYPHGGGYGKAREFTKQEIKEYIGEKNDFVAISGCDRETMKLFQEEKTTIDWINGQVKELRLNSYNKGETV